MRESIAEATDFMLRIAVDICYAAPFYIDMVCDEKSGIAKVIRAFYLSCGYTGLSVLNSCLSDAHDELRDLAKATVKSCKGERAGLFGKRTEN